MVTHPANSDIRNVLSTIFASPSKLQTKEVYRAPGGLLYAAGGLCAAIIRKSLRPGLEEAGN